MPATIFPSFTGGATVAPDPQMEKIRPKWIIPMTWNNLQALVKLPYYRDVVKQVKITRGLDPLDTNSKV